MKSIKFYGETLTRTKIINNIIRVYKAAADAKTSGLYWYLDAHDFAKELSVQHISRNLGNGLTGSFNSKTTTYFLTKCHIAGIISALSPLQNWNRNKELTIQFIELLESGGDPLSLPYMKGQIKKALKIANLKSSGSQLTRDISEILNGEKTVSFFLNISNPLTSDAITVDRHALSICLGKKLSTDQFKNHSMTKRQYEFFAECYLSAAQKLGLNGLSVQSQTWEFWRIEGETFQKNLNNVLKLK